MTSDWTDLDRPPLDPDALSRALGRGGSGLWRVQVSEQTGSTNADAAAAARSGEPEGLVVVAEAQTAGRGRLERAWVSPPRAGLTFSVLLRPDVAPVALPLLPLLVGEAVAAAVAERTGLAVGVKWPNDVVLDGPGGLRKLAGVLAESTGDGAVVVGVGLNVSTRREELPRADATSLALEAGEPVDRATLLLAVLRVLEGSYRSWVADGGSGAALLPRYRAACRTIGSVVRVEMPSGTVLTGTATGVDPDGRLLVDDGAEVHRVGAGDVVHVRPAG